jgi:hypothetical protein
VTFEASFFGPGNRLRWDAIQAGSSGHDVKARLEPFLEDLRHDPEVLILPCVREDGRTQWYVMCSSTRAARVARDEVRAFLGPSYSDFEGRPSRLDPADGVESAVLARSGMNAFRLEIPERALTDVARERLRLLIGVRNERPPRHARRTRVAGRILRDFEYALITGADAVALDCIGQLRAGGQLGVANLLFLEVRRLEARMGWDAIVALPELNSLMAMRRPRRVTEALIRAVYATQLRGFQEANDATGAIERFRVLLPQYGDLYRTRAGLSGFEVDASFLMMAATSAPPRADIAAGILQDYGPESSGQAYLVALADQAHAPVSARDGDAAERARAAFAAADVDRAFEVALTLPPSFERCALLVRCASEMGTLAAAQLALNAADVLLEPDRSRLSNHAVLGRIRAGLAALACEQAAADGASATAEVVPSSWADWLARLTAPVPWRAAVQVAEVAAREWRIEGLASDSVGVQMTTDALLGDRPLWGQIALRDALPYLLEVFLSGGADARLRSVYEALFLVVAVDDQVSVPRVGALLRIAEARLQIGVESADYSDVLRELGVAIEAIESPVIVEQALDALDVLVGTACPTPRDRQEFLGRVAALFRRWYRRIDAGQWALLRSFGEELGVPELVQLARPEDGPRETSSIWARLDGKRVAMYSLRDRALHRVEAVLRELCPGVRVESFNDHVGGAAALRAAATGADIFILATAAAKHAATGFIESHRPKARATLYASGQGSASLLEAVRRYLARPSSAVVGEPGPDE